MKEVKIPKIEVYGEGSSLSQVAVLRNMRGVSIEISDLPEFGGKPDALSPLELLLASLVSCEIFMFKMMAHAFNIKEEFKVQAEASGKFKLKEGLVELNFKFKVKGIDKETAKTIWNYVKEQCPIYSTLKKSVKTINEEFYAA